MTYCATYNKKWKCSVFVKKHINYRIGQLMLNALC